jgi:hypothetical protein
MQDSEQVKAGVEKIAVKAFAIASSYDLAKLVTFWRRNLRPEC